MKRIILFYATILICGKLFAQPHIQQIQASADGHFVQQSVAPLAEDEYVVVGTVVPGAIAGSDILVFVTDDAGNIIWSRYIDYGFDEFAGAVIVDHRGDIVLTGYTGRNNTNNKNLIVVKLNSNGNYLGDAVITDGGILDYGLYGLDIEVGENGYIIVGTGVDDTTQIADKYAFVLHLQHNLESSMWGRIYRSTMGTPTHYDSFNHILRIDHPVYGESFLLTGSGANNGPNSSQMVVNDLINPITGLSVWNQSNAQGNREPDPHNNIGVMALYHESSDEFFVLYYGSDDFPSYRKNIPSLLTLDGLSGTTALSHVAFFNHVWGNQNNIFTGMQWSSSNQDEIVLSGYHIDAGNPPQVGYPLLVRYGLSTGSIWSRYHVGFDGADYANINLDFIVDPVNLVNPSSPYELNEIYYHPKSLVLKNSVDPSYVFAAPQQEEPLDLFGVNLLNTNSNGDMPCMDSVRGLDELASLSTFTNFISQAYNFRLLEPGAMVYNAILLNSLTCESDAKPFIGPNGNTQQMGIQLYPNPANNLLNISGLPEIENGDIALYDLQGRIVLSQAYQGLSSTKQLDISTLENGVYFLKISENGESMFVERLVKK